MKTLKSLEKSNKDNQWYFQQMNDNSPEPNGIACPKCGGELLDSTPNIVLTSYPPQYNIHCPKCDYTGYRF